MSVAASIKAVIIVKTIFFFFSNFSFPPPFCSSELDSLAQDIGTLNWDIKHEWKIASMAAHSGFFDDFAEN